MTPATPLHRNSGTSLHHQVFLLLREEIARGQYAATGALPTEEALCARFNVSRATVRRALAELVLLRIVERRHGLGTFVQPDAGSIRSSLSLSVLDSLRQTVAQTKVEVLSFKRTQPPPDVTRLLQFEADAKAVHVVRLRSTQGVPVMVTDAWLPLSVGSQLTGSMLRKQPLYALLLAQGLTFGRVVQETSATLADPIIAAHLAIPVGSPALRLVRLMHDADDRPLLHLTVHAAAERTRILMEIPASAVDTLPTGHLVHEVFPRAARRARGSKG